MAKMRELDAPTTTAVQECGDSMMGGMPPVAPQVPPHNPPTLSVNLNAQGMDDIESIMRLMTKVNPDMINQPAPAAGLPTLTGPGPTITSIKPELPPLKMLPDFDSEPEGDHAEPDADNMGGPSDNDADNSIDVIQKSMGDLDSDGDKDGDDMSASQGDLDNDGDHDMDDHDMEKEKGKDESWGNGVSGHDDVDYKGMDASVPNGNDIHKPKQMFKRSQPGDNPMATEGTDLRSQIRAELLRRLNETKGAK